MTVVSLITGFHIFRLYWGRGRCFLSSRTHCKTMDIIIISFQRITATFGGSLWSFQTHGQTKKLQQVLHNRANSYTSKQISNSLKVRIFLEYLLYLTVTYIYLYTLATLHIEFVTTVSIFGNRLIYSSTIIDGKFGF